MNQFQKEICHALNILVKDGEKQLKESIQAGNYAGAATSQAYLNGLEVAKSIVKQAE